MKFTFNRSPLLLAMLACPVTAWAEPEKVMSEITVTGGAEVTEERREAATQKTVVSRKEIENLGGINIGEVMGKLPGIDAGGGGSMGLRSRGMMRDSVQILVDGERLAANSRLTMLMIERLPSSELDRVEISRGSSAEFGGGAPVTVNLVMRKAVSKASRSIKLAPGLREGGEPFGNLNYCQGDGDAGFSWLLPISYFLHGSVSDKHTTRQNFAAGVRSLWQEDDDLGRSPGPGLSLAPRFNWKRGADSFSLWPSLMVAGGERDNDMSRYSYAAPATGGGYAPDGSRADRDDDLFRQFRLRGEGEIHLGDNKLSGRLAYMDGKRDTDSRHTSQDALGVTTMSTENLRRREHEWSGALRLDSAFDPHLLATGLDFTSHRRRDDQTLTTTTSYLAEELHLTAWVQDEWNLSKGVILTSGLRAEAVRLEVDGAAQDYQRISPSIAARWEPKDGWVLRSSLGAGLKTPKLEELSNLPVTSLSANSPLEADRRGNPNLLPERSVNFEAVIERYLADKASVLGANFYWRATDNFIERRVTLEGARWVDRPQNEGDAVHYGLELDAKVRTDAWGLKGGTLRGHLTLPRSEVKDTRLGITRSARETPAFQLTLGHDQSLPAWKGSVGFQVQFYGRTKSDVPGEQWAGTDARSVLDLYALRKLTPNLNLRLNLQNVLGADTRKQEAAWNGADTWLLDSENQGARSVLLSLEGKW